MTWRSPAFWIAAIAACVIADYSPLEALAQTTKNPTVAATAATSIDSALERQLADIDTRAGAVKDLTANFTQRKFTAMLKKPLVSSGQVRALGAVIRWDTKSPEPNVLYTDGKELRLYYPGQKLMEIYPIDQRLSDLLASPVPRLKAVRDLFAIERAPPNTTTELLASANATTRPQELVGLTLTPTDTAIKQHVQHVTVILDPQTALVLAVQTIDSDGDTTDMTFSDAHRDTGLKPRDLLLTVPAGTNISHPLQGASSPGSR
jgi:outer membrane lipoprotein-sorting protein